MLIIFKCERQLYFELQCRRARRDLGYHLNQIPCFTSDGTEAQKSLVTCSRSDLSDLIKGFAENCGPGPVFQALSGYRSCFARPRAQQTGFSRGSMKMDLGRRGSYTTM